jgi:hypothetical protein
MMTTVADRPRRFAASSRVEAMKSDHTELQLNIYNPIIYSLILQCGIYVKHFFENFSALRSLKADVL